MRINSSRVKVNKDGTVQLKEKAIQDQIVHSLINMGYEVIRFNSGGGNVSNSGRGSRWLWFFYWFGRIGQKRHRGVPDLYVFGKGIQAWLECKTKKGSIRDDQDDFITAHTECGLAAYTVRTLESALEYIQELQRVRDNNLPKEKEPVVEEDKKVGSSRKVARKRTTSND